jgi:signal peptidase I
MGIPPDTPAAKPTRNAGTPADRADILLEALESGSSGILHVRGNSMLPTLSEGTVVRIRPAGANEIAVGRIAVFRKDRLLVIHRLVWKRRRNGTISYLFKGDNAANIDGIEADGVLGVVEGIVTAPTSGTPNGAAWEPLGWDAAGLFYRISHLLLSPLFRFVGFLTGRPDSLPAGRSRDLLKRVHRMVERILFRRRKTH